MAERDDIAATAGDPMAAVAFDAGGATAPKPRISTREEAERLAPGTSFIGPDDKERVVPYKISHPEQIASIPDGADFMGPDGKLRQKPKYEGIDFTAQTLYDMGVNDKERKRALERSYPGKVKDDPAGGFFVDDEGTLRKPGRGIQRFTGGVSAAAAPTVLSILGALGGGAIGGGGGAVAGSEVPVVGTVAGAGAGAWYGGALGGAGGAVLGQSFNDMIMGLAGTYDRSRTEEAAELTIAGAGGLAGAGVGRGVSTIVPSIKTGVSALTAAAPGAARSIAGIKSAEQQANLSTARQLSEKGVLVPPSAVFPELPHVQNLVEVFDPAFHTNRPLLESATAHFEKSSSDILHAIGVKDPGTLTKPIADVPTKETGEALMRKTLAELAEKDAQMQAALDARKAALSAGQPEQLAQREALQKAADQSRVAAQKVIDAGYKDIETDVATAMKVAKADANAGDLWAAIGQKLIATRQAVGARAKVMYNAADEAAGGHLPNIEGLPPTAENFLKQLPPDFQSKYPDIVRKLRDLAGVKDEAGEWIKEPHEPTFGELHDLRSQFRSNVNYNDLAPGIREGVYKFFANKVDQVLHGINEAESTVAPKFEAKSFDEFVKGIPESKFAKADPTKIRRVAENIDPLIKELESKFPSLAKQLRDIRNQLGSANDNVDIDAIWDRLDNALTLVEKNAGESPLTQRISKMLIDIGEVQDEPYMRHSAMSAERNSMYKDVYKHTYDQLVDPNASWQKHTPVKQMLESLERPYEDRSGNPVFAYAEKMAWDDAAKVLRSRTGADGRVEALKQAADLLDKADKFYSENIKIFNAQQVKAVMKGLEAGEPADPQNLYNVIVRSGQTDLTNRLKEIVGPNLWAGVKGADMQAMLDASKTIQPGVIDGRTFVKEVLTRTRDGTLQLVHGKEASEKLLEQARRIEMLDGRLPIPVHPGDTMTQVIARARQAEEVAKAEAKRDPLTTLNREMKKLEMERQAIGRRSQVAFKNDPLNFLYNPTTGATEAVDRILGSEDLILAAAAKFGEKSPEFEQLRQIWAQRFLRSSMRPAEKLESVSPEIQQLMFPGVTLNQMRTLAKEMDFLMDTRAGKGTAAGMAAMARVEHPWGSGFFGKGIQTAAKLTTGPLADAGARTALGAYYSTIRKLTTSPALFRWLEKGLNGSPADRQAVRDSIEAVLQKGGAAGAGLGEAGVQWGGPQ